MTICPFVQVWTSSQRCGSWHGLGAGRHTQVAGGRPAPPPGCHGNWPGCPACGSRCRGPPPPHCCREIPEPRHKKLVLILIRNHLQSTFILTRLTAASFVLNSFSLWRRYCSISACASSFACFRRRFFPVQDTYTQIKTQIHTDYDTQVV